MYINQIIIISSLKNQSIDLFVWKNSINLLIENTPYTKEFRKYRKICIQIISFYQSIYLNDSLKDLPIVFKHFWYC